MEAFRKYLERCYETGEWDEKFVDFVEKEKIIKSYFRYTILGETEKAIYDTQYEWSFIECLRQHTN
jgi:hypothetical protein